MRIVNMAGALVMIVACARKPATPRLPSAAEPRAPVASAPAPISDLPPPLLRPRDVACTLTDKVWPTEDLESFERGRQFLRFEPGGRPFAELYGGTDVELVIPAALAAAGGTLTIYSNGVFVTGHLEAAEMPLYPARPFVLSSVFVPSYERRLIWRSARSGFITVTTEPIPRLRGALDELSAERPCKDFSLGDVIFDDAAIDKAIGTRKPDPPVRPPWPWLRAGVIGVSAEPDGKVIAEIDVIEPRDDRLLIHPPRVLAVKKGWTRIAVGTYGGVVFGWVESDNIVTSSKEYLDLSHDSRTVRVYQGRLDGKFVACDHDMPLVAEVGSVRHLVGTVRARTPLEARATKDGWTAVAFRDSGVVPVDGASLLVREPDLHGCSPAPERPKPAR